MYDRAGAGYSGPVRAAAAAAAAGSRTGSLYNLSHKCVIIEVVASGGGGRRLPVGRLAQQRQRAGVYAAPRSDGGAGVEQ